MPCRCGTSSLAKRAGSGRVAPSDVAASAVSARSAGSGCSDAMRRAAATNHVLMNTASGGWPITTADHSTTASSRAVKPSICRRASAMTACIQFREGRARRCAIACNIFASAGGVALLPSAPWNARIAACSHGALGECPSDANECESVASSEPLKPPILAKLSTLARPSHSPPGSCRNSPSPLTRAASPCGGSSPRWSNVSATAARHSDCAPREGKGTTSGVWGFGTGHKGGLSFLPYRARS
mmetsp:Transcript_23763/g.70549  ORF Transcript_23763/g.70549 Transcript_23763/m.70549 type:complete len:242 (-) Transcript_23763:267-992(-)